MAIEGQTHWLSYVFGEESDLKALYTQGSDNRHNINEVKDLAIVQQAESVACLMESERLLKEGETYKLNNVKTLSERFPSKPLTLTSNFREEPAPGFGTAFLVAKNLALTAGHCVCKRGTQELDDARIKNTRFVFGLKIKSQNQIADIPKMRVCKIVKVVSWSQKPTEGDWALVELKRGPNTTPLTMEFTNVVHHTMQIYMLGHPSGLPMKYTDSGQVMETGPVGGDPQRFQAKIDAFAGNSGSPVFNATTQKVIGILVAGNSDYQSSIHMTSPHYVTSDEIRDKGFEKCQRTSTLPEIVIKKIDPNQQEEHLKAIEECTTIQTLIKEKKTDEAIKLLEPLSNQGLAVAHVALATLLTDQTKQAKQKKKALASGFFNEATFNSVIILPQPENSATSKANADGIQLMEKAEAKILAAKNAQASAKGAVVGKEAKLHVGAGLSDEAILEALKEKK